MHSRIYQLERSLGDIDDYNLKEYQFDFDGRHSWFVRQVADYVDEDTNKEEDIRWFLECIRGFNEYFMINNKGLEIESITFLPGFKQAYFSNRFNRLKEDVENMTIENFTDSMAIYRIQALIEDKFGFYICNADYLMSMDDFVRDLPEQEITYYFGNTIDYHW